MLTVFSDTQVIHARSGVPHEIMGLMQGKVVGTSLVIIDSFALPVQGTETRVNAQNEANEYMVQYIQGSERVSAVYIQLIINVLKAYFDSGPTFRERRRMVSLPSRIWLLALRDRRRH